MKQTTLMSVFLALGLAACQNEQQIPDSSGFSDISISNSIMNCTYTDSLKQTEAEWQLNFHDSTAIKINSPIRLFLPFDHFKTGKDSAFFAGAGKIYSSHIKAGHPTVR